MHNLVHVYAVRDRVTPETKLSTEYPSAEAIEDLPLDHYIVDDEDISKLKEEMNVMVERMLVDHLSCFEDLHEVMWWHIPHRYIKASATKSTVVRIQTPYQVK